MKISGNWNKELLCQLILYYTKDAPHLCIQNTKMNEFNNSLSGTRYSFKAHDSVVEADSRHAVRE